jgi:glycosyltransferase involved in cell wall biosynthesis
MRVLALLPTRDIDRTSGGLCSRKLVEVLRDTPDVVLSEVAGEDGEGRPAAPAAQTWFRRKCGAAVSYATGLHSSAWREVRLWQSRIESAAASQRADVIFAQSKGSEFYPHFALLRARTGTPWVANYHDPYPISLYPEPYRTRVPVITFWQERLHARVLRHCGALTFPSERLLRWVLAGPFERYREKAFVVPHVARWAEDGHGAADTAVGAGNGWSPGSFVLLHTGTLLSKRSPRNLIRAYRRFLEGSPERREKSRLVFVGRAHRDHENQREWIEAREHPNIEIVARRVPYNESLRLLRAAAVPVVLEASGAESPFYPGKLADYLAAEKPILALSPSESVTADLLGRDYPLLAPPDDEEGIARAIERAWAHWREGRLAALLPPPSARRASSPDVVRRRLIEAFEYARSGRVAR